MTWRIPPVGWCAVCLLARHHETAAKTQFRGTSLCEEHLEMAFADDLEMVLVQARAEDADADEMVVAGSTSTCLHCMEEIIFGVHTAREWSHRRHADTWCHDAANFTKTPLQRATPDPAAGIVPPPAGAGDD